MQAAACAPDIVKSPRSYVYSKCRFKILLPGRLAKPLRRHQVGVCQVSNIIERLDPQQSNLVIAVSSAKKSLPVGHSVEMPTDVVLKTPTYRHTHSHRKPKSFTIRIFSILQELFAWP